MTQFVSINNSISPVRVFSFLLLFGLSCSTDAVVQAPAVPVFNIQVLQDIPSDHKVPAVFQEVSEDSIRVFPAKIERRGGYSISFPKQSFEIDLETDVSLAGLPADDDWIFNANYIDKTFLRHVLSYELFRAMHPNNQAVGTRFVELQLNGSYQGLYVLMEKLDKSCLGISRKDPAAVIFKEPPIFIPDLEGFQPQDPDNFYQQTYPDKEQDDRTELIADIRSFLVTSPDSIFARRVGELFDLQNITDWHILLLLSNNSDGLRKNFYIYQLNAKTPLRVAPWDYDHSFGRDGDNEMNMIRPLDCTKSLILKRLLEQPFYCIGLKNRWEVLVAKGLLSLEGLLKRIDHYQAHLAPLVERNFARWPVDGPIYYDDNDFEAEIALMKQYLRQRHGELEGYFAGL